MQRTMDTNMESRKTGGSVMKKSTRYEGALLDEYDLELYSSYSLNKLKRMFYKAEKEDTQKKYFYLISTLLPIKEKEVLYTYGLLKNGITKESLQQEGIDTEVLEAASILYQSKIQHIKENDLSKAVKIAILHEDIIFFTEEENTEKVKELQEKLAYIQGD